MPAGVLHFDVRRTNDRGCRTTTIVDATVTKTVVVMTLITTSVMVMDERKGKQRDRISVTW